MNPSPLKERPVPPRASVKTIPLSRSMVQKPLNCSNPHLSFTGSSHCCVKYNRKPIPLKLLVSYEYAGSTCPLFITKGKKRICTNPDDQDNVPPLPSPQEEKRVQSSSCFECWKETAVQNVKQYD
uniref:Chemokine interleukin-8-like domain-containing protein n=1 Tax=Podarcis muralis TaxID=64176 RepID=A0A670JR10_PODMU